MMEPLNRFRFGLLSAHYRLSGIVRQTVTPAVIFRLLFAAGLMVGSNLNGLSRGIRIEQEANWNGADYVNPSADAQEAMIDLSDDTGATVEVYAINYRLPGYYKGIWGTDGVPKNRYLARDVQWLELQRSECVTSDQVLDGIERSQVLEIYCPINFGELSLPVGFVMLRWSGRRPKQNSLPGYTDRLFDVGRLINR